MIFFGLIFHSHSYQPIIDKMPPAIGGRRRRLRSIGEFLTTQHKPDLEPVYVRTSQRPSKFGMQMKKIFGESAFSLKNGFSLKSLFKRRKGGEITPAEALNADPNAIFAAVQQMNKLDEESDAAMTAADSVFQPGLADQLLPDEKSIDVSETWDEDGYSVVPSSIGNSALGSKHGYGANRPAIREGDTLPTGHKVKNAYNKSVVQKIEESEDFKSIVSQRSNDERFLKKVARKREKDHEREIRRKAGLLK